LRFLAAGCGSGYTVRQAKAVKGEANMEIVFPVIILMFLSVSLVASCLIAHRFGEPPISQKWSCRSQVAAVVYLASLVIDLWLWLKIAIGSAQANSNGLLDQVLSFAVLPHVALLAGATLVVFRRPRLLVGIIGGAVLGTAGGAGAGLLFEFAIYILRWCLTGSFGPVSVEHMYQLMFAFGCFGYQIGPGIGLPVAFVFSWFVSLKRRVFRRPHPPEASPDLPALAADADERPAI